MSGFGIRAVDLVQRDDDGHLGGAGVVDRLERLRRDAFDGGHDEDDHVGHLRAAGAHAGERLVAGGVDERDALACAVAAFDLDHPRGGVLRDAAGFTRRDVGAADLVEQARLAVVDVAEDRDDRRARHAALGGAPRARELGDEASSSVAAARPSARCRIPARSSRGVAVEALVDGREHALLHQPLEDVVALDAERGESDLTVIGSSMAIGSPRCTPVLAWTWWPRCSDFLR
jgi:hypothetical protein